MRVAIVGSGVSGLSALWLLNEHSEHEVNIYEKEDYPGGHTHTVEFKHDSCSGDLGSGKPACQVDTGFIVLNPTTYPNFLRFLRRKKVPLNETEMTFSVSRDRGAFEWAGDGPLALFCQMGNLFNPRMYRMIFDILRFNLFATDLLGLEGRADIKRMSIGEYLNKEGYGEAFKEDYLLPMTGAIWSTPADKAALDFPALTLVRFFHNHHLLQITGKPKWMTVKGGSKLYVDSILEKLPQENLHLNTEIVAVSSRPDGVELVEKSGQRHLYDHVIMATHSDTTLKLLKAGGQVTPQEDKALSVWEWSKNEAVLHWDERFRPTRSKAYSAWNYLTSTQKPSRDPQTTSSKVDTVALTYGMNILQHLPESTFGPVLVTLNPPFPVDPLKTIGTWTYEHPSMTDRSVSSQSLLPSIQNKRKISFAGAWTKYGFHEDGFSSGMRLVCAPPFNVKPPFDIRPPHRPIHEKGGAERFSRWVVFAIQGVVVRSYVGNVIWSWVVVGALWWIGVLQGLGRAFGLAGVERELERLRVCWGEGEAKDEKVAVGQKKTN